MRSFDIGERRARLARRHHLSPAHWAVDVVEASDGLVCLHATDPATVYVSAWARVGGLSVADLDRALYVDRTLVRHLCMRRTLFVFRRPLFGVIQPAASQRVADQEAKALAKRVEKEGLVEDGTKWLTAAAEAALEALSTMGEATATELRKAVPLLGGSIIIAPGKPYGGPASVAPNVLTILSASGRVMRGPNRGAWNVSRPVWTTTARWLGSEPALWSEPEARAELVRRWLVAFGPATVTDLKWWLGSTLTSVRAALTDVGAVEVDLDGRAGVALADDLDPVAPVEPYGVLLPGLDPTTMGWFERDWYLGSYKAQIFDSNGNAGTTAWWDGRIVGGWNQTKDGTVFLQLLEDVGSDATSALEAEAARLTGWLAGVRVVPRFPSPLSKSGLT